MAVSHNTLDRTLTYLATEEMQPCSRDKFGMSQPSNHTITVF